MKTVFNGVTVPMGPQILLPDATLEALGASPIGKNLFKVASENGIRYIKIRADNGVELLTADELLAELNIGSNAEGVTITNVQMAAAATQTLLDLVDEKLIIEVLGDTNAMRYVTLPSAATSVLGQRKWININSVGGRFTKLTVTEPDTSTVVKTGDHWNTNGSWFFMFDGTAWQSMDDPGEGQYGPAYLALENRFTNDNHFGVNTSLVIQSPDGDPNPGSRGIFFATDAQWAPEDKTVDFHIGPGYVYGDHLKGNIDTQSGEFDITNRIVLRNNATFEFVETVGNTIRDGCAAALDAAQWSKSGTFTQAISFKGDFTIFKTGGSIPLVKVTLVDNKIVLSGPVAIDAQGSLTVTNTINGNIAGNAGTVSSVSSNLEAGPGITLAPGTGSKVKISATGTGGGGDDAYGGTGEATIEVGGFVPGDILTGMTYDQMWEKLLIKYIDPAFSQFNVDGLGGGQTFEVGTVFNPDWLFQWETDPDDNGLHSVQLFVSTSGVASNWTTLATAQASTGSISIPGGANAWADKMTAQGKWFRVLNDSTKFNSYERHNRWFGIQPYFYGKQLGGTRPTASPALITSGTKVLQGSIGNITIPYGNMQVVNGGPIVPPAATDWNWFAIPSPEGVAKTKWYVDALNNGNIGPGANLFPGGESIVNVSSVLWNGKTYLVYIANYQTALANCEMRNS